ncbi:hypothetical protein, partial [Nonomuraea sp. NPDC050691]|uniref:hypothetical protein n=1 Tax=Nonomuraea sp. NPDC050691 TaxID=3155661 RepID=UPI00340F82A6
TNNTTPTTRDAAQPGDPRKDAPTGAHPPHDTGPGTSRIDQLINRDGTPPPMDPAVIALGRDLARRLWLDVPDDAYAHSLGTMGNIAITGMSKQRVTDIATALHKVSQALDMPATFDGLVRVYDEAQRQGFDPAGAADKSELVERLDGYRQTDPHLFTGLWLAKQEITNPSFPLARALGRIDQALGHPPKTDLLTRISHLRGLTFELDLGLHSLDHVGRLFVAAQAQGVDVQNAAARQELVRGLRQARQHDTELWDGLRIADEHAVGGLDDAAARTLSRADRALHSVSPDGGLRDLAAETGFSHAFRSFSQMLAEADVQGAIPERPATRAELVEALTRFREHNADGWDLRVMEERFPGTRLDAEKTAVLSRMDRVIAGDRPPRQPLDRLLELSRELGLGDSPGRLLYVADRAQRLGFDPMGAADRPALVDALRGYMDTSPNTWARVRVADRYALKLDEPAARALARMDLIVGPQDKAPAWVLDPLRKLAGDLGLEHSVQRLAHVFRGAEEHGLDPGGATDRADLVNRLTSYHRPPAEPPYHFRPTMPRMAEETLTERLRQNAARDAGVAGAALARSGDFSSGLEVERVRALDARARAWESRPAEPEVSYRWNPEAFERDLAEAFARAERGEPVVPYMTEDATGGLAAPGTGFKFGREIEYDLPMALKPHKDAINQAIARDLYDAGLTQDPWIHGHHASRDAGYYEGDDGWRLEVDSSTDGELVSPPMYDTPRTWEAIRLACEIITSHGGVVTDTTGGHVHVDTSVFDHIPAFYQRLLRLVNDDYLDTFMRLLANPEQSGHRGLFFCEPNMMHSVGYATIDELVALEKKRETMVNVQSVRGGRTDHTEFRLPDGSLDPGVIQAQTKLVLGTVGLALRLGEDRFPLNHGHKDASGNHTNHLRQRDYSSYLELADHLFHRAVDKAQLTALFAITRWSEKQELWWRS